MLKQHEQPLPYLREYLAELNFAPQPGAIFITLGIFLSIGAFVSMILFPHGYIGLLEFAVLAASAFGGAILAKQSFRKKNPGLFTQQHRRVVTVAHQMVATKRLHKAIDSGPAELLEESARLRREIRVSLLGPSWSAPELPLHWQQVKFQALAATDEAMEEILLLLQSSFRPYAGPQGLQAKVEDVVEAFVTGPRFRKEDMLPAEFEPARKLAEKLKLLARQIREATHDLSREVVVSGKEDVATALDIAINDIRSIQSAEMELNNRA